MSGMYAATQLFIVALISRLIRPAPCRLDAPWVRLRFGEVNTEARMVVSQFGFTE